MGLTGGPGGPIDEHATPLTYEEERELRASYVTTRAQLNELEQAGILTARAALRRSRLTAAKILDERWLLRTHERMFSEVWRWARKIRTIGVDHWTIRAQLRELLDDALTWVEYGSWPPDEIALRFHHRLVAIHPFVNGNGRHARLVTDLLAVTLGRPEFTWGGQDLTAQGDVRRRYVQALQAADAGDYAALLTFART